MVSRRQKKQINAKKSNICVMKANYKVMKSQNYFQIFTEFDAVYPFDANHFFLHEKIMKSGYLWEDSFNDRI